MNETYVCLIPRKENATRVQEYKPVSLVTSLYKIIAKILADKLRQVLHSTISRAQRAFIVGRQILDQVLIAKEAIEDYRKKK